MATETPPKPAAQAANASVSKNYRIMRKLTLDLTDPASLVDQLKKIAGDESKPVVVFALIGEPTGASPKAAAKAFGANNDLDGEYEFVAEKSITTLVIKTESKRDVSIG